MFCDTVEVQGVGTLFHIRIDANHTLEVALGEILRIERHFNGGLLASPEVISAEIEFRTVT